MERLNALWTQATAYAARLSARERAALSALAAVAAIVLALGAIDWAQSAQSAAEEARAERVALARLAAEGDVSLDLRAEAEHARDYSIRAATAPIAGLRAQTLLTAKASDSGVQNLEVSLLAAEADSHIVRASIEGDFDWSVFQELLRNLSASSESFAPIAIDLRLGERPRFRLDVQAATAPAS